MNNTLLSLVTLLALCRQVVGDPAPSSTYRLEARTVVSSAVGIDIETSALTPDSRAAVNRPTNVAKMGDKAVIDLGQIDIITNVGNVGKVFEVPRGVRVVLDLVLKTRVAAARQGELNFRLEPNLANGFSRVAISAEQIDWRQSDGIALTNGAPYKRAVPVGAAAHQIQLALDLDYGTTPGQKTNTILVDLVGSF